MLSELLLKGEMMKLEVWKNFLDKVKGLGFVTLETDCIKHQYRDSTSLTAAHRQNKLILLASNNSPFDKGNIVNDVHVYGCLSIDQAVMFHTILGETEIGAISGPYKKELYSFSISCSHRNLPQFLSILETMSKQLTFTNWDGAHKDTIKVKATAPQWVRNFIV